MEPPAGNRESVTSAVSPDCEVHDEEDHDGELNDDTGQHDAARRGDSVSTFRSTFVILLTLTGFR